jgi:hypothetical protein
MNASKQKKKWTFFVNTPAAQSRRLRFCLFLFYACPLLSSCQSVFLPLYTYLYMYIRASLFKHLPHLSLSLFLFLSLSLSLSLSFSLFLSLSLSLSFSLSFSLSLFLSLSLSLSDILIYHSITLTSSQSVSFTRS